MRWIVLAVMLVMSSGAWAVNPDEILADPVLEARARGISKGLRCLVCQNQSIDDSDAGLARDLRLIVRERLVAGDSDRAVLRFVVARYGDFVLLKPPVMASTYALWFGPPLLLLLGIAGLVVYGRRARGQPEPAALSADEQHRLNEIMGGDGKT